MLTIDNPVWAPHLLDSRAGVALELAQMIKQIRGFIAGQDLATCAHFPPRVTVALWPHHSSRSYAAATAALCRLASRRGGSDGRLRNDSVLAISRSMTVVFPATSCFRRG